MAGSQKEIEDLRKKISESTEENKQDLETFFSSVDISLDILRLKFLSKLADSKKNISCIESDDYETSDVVGKIFGDVKVLEMFLSSGDVENGDWNKALELLAKLIKTDPEVTCHPLKLKLAVAVALTFAMPVISYAYKETNKEIDPVQRYLSFSSWCLIEPSPMFEIIENVSCWHLRHVVGSWAEDYELQWARDHVSPEFFTPIKIGEATHSMIKYRDYNEDGVSIHKGAEFYNHRPETLELLHQEGGVCGVVSKFGAAVCQAFGVPAMPLGQPGHCAFTWYTGDGWILGNDISGWESSCYHDGIQVQWNRSAPFIRLMSDAQEGGMFAISEKMRTAASTLSPERRIGMLFSCVLPKCPENYDAWMDFLQLAKDTGLIGYSENVAEGKPVAVSSTEERAQNLTENSGSEWWTDEETAWIEIDLEKICVVERVKIQWWGFSKADTYKVFAIAQNGEKSLVKTEKDQTVDKAEQKNDCNQWINLAGWEEETCKVRLELSNGNKDPWNMNMLFGLRQIQVFSVSTAETNSNLTDIYEAFEKEVEIQEKESEERHIISDRKPVRVSSTDERAMNITEGSGSEWWTGDETAWIEIDLEGTFVVEEVKIQWWGYSKADTYKVFAIAQNGQKSLVKTEKDQTVDKAEQGNDCNQWINLAGWEEETCKVRLELSNGNKDPWNMNMLFGLRGIVIYGREKVRTVNLCGNNWQELVVDRNRNSSGFDLSLKDQDNIVWKGNDPESWIEIDFGGIRCVKSIEIDWEDEGKAENVGVIIKRSSDDVKIGSGDVDSEKSLNHICSKIRLDFLGNNVRVKSVKVYGVKYTNKDIIVGRMKRLLKDHPFVCEILMDRFLKY